MLSKTLAAVAIIALANAAGTFPQKSDEIENLLFLQSGRFTFMDCWNLSNENRLSCQRLRRYCHSLQVGPLGFNIVFHTDQSNSAEAYEGFNNAAVRHPEFINTSHPHLKGPY